MKHARADYNRIQDPAGIIPEDEPVFLLRGTDPIAARTIRFWAEQAEEAGVNPDIIARARQQADKIDNWPAKKLPDMPWDA